MKVSKINNPDFKVIQDSETVKVKQMLRRAELRVTKGGHEGSIKKLNSEEYLDLRTGEVKEFEKATNRSESLESLSVTLKTLRDLINTNFGGYPNEFFITLTYKENMTDKKKANSDFKAWIRSMRKKKNFGDLEYICVYEPQGRGAWHMHVLCKFKDITALKKEDIKKIRELWGHGSFVNVKPLRDIDNVGAYLSAYMTDVELTQENAESYIEQYGTYEGMKVVEKQVDGLKKRFIKGGRIHMYKSYSKLFSTSKGINRPTEFVCTKKDFLENKKAISDNVEMTFSQINIIYDNDTRLASNRYENYKY